MSVFYLKLLENRHVSVVCRAWYSQHVTPAPYLKSFESLSICGFGCSRPCTVQSNGVDEAADQVFFSLVGYVTVPRNFAQLGHCIFCHANTSP